SKNEKALASRLVRTQPITVTVPGVVSCFRISAIRVLGMRQYRNGRGNFNRFFSADRFLPESTGAGGKESLLPSRATTGIKDIHLVRVPRKIALDCPEGATPFSRNRL